MPERRINGRHVDDQLSRTALHAHRRRTTQTNGAPITTAHIQRMRDSPRRHEAHAAEHELAALQARINEQQHNNTKEKH